MSLGKEIDPNTLNVGDVFVAVVEGGPPRTMRVTEKNGDIITAVWVPDSEERAKWDAIGWQYAEEMWGH